LSVADWQGKESLVQLVTLVRRARDEMDWSFRADGPPPILVKIAPDLTREDKIDIAAVALEQKLGGLIISNTTIQRPLEVREENNNNKHAYAGTSNCFTHLRALLVLQAPWH
jgi:dihydroorotate dehydrogenase